MKEGDIIEWRGKSGILHGRVRKFQYDGNEVLVCQLDNGKVFPLNDLRHSKSAKLIEV